MSGTPYASPSSSQQMLHVTGLSVTFTSEAGPVRAVRDVSLSVSRGEVLGVVGESGSGKSVSSMAVLGLLPRNATVRGSIRFHGEELVGAPEKRLRTLRGNRIAMIFQDPMTTLNPVMSVGAQLSEAYRIHHDVSKKVSRAKAVEALGLVGIPQPSRRAAQFPHEFSGGMRQRAVIAMAIINEPDLLIADEPTTALDVTVQAQIMEKLAELTRQIGSGIVLITHDLGVVAGAADRVQVMYGGTVVEQGPVDEVFHRPKMPYTAGLLSSVPRAAGLGQPLVPIPGAPPSLVNLPPGCSFAPRCDLVAPACRELEPDLLEIGEHAHWTRCHRSGDIPRRSRAAQVDALLDASPTLERP